MKAVDATLSSSSPTVWGLLSTAKINDRILAGAREARGVTVVGVASRSLAKARSYAEARGLGRAYGSYDELLADPEIDAVYISLPNQLHVEWSLRSLHAGKHVLCEKPLGRDAREVEAACHAADRAGLRLCEAFMWRHLPQTRQLQRLISDGAIGQVTEVTCRFTFDLRREREEAGADWLDDVRMSPESHGGALMDVGAYCVNAIRLFAGEPTHVEASQEIGETGVDLRVSAVMECDSGVIGRFSCSLIDARHEELRIAGEDGTLVVPAPFLCRAPGIELEHGGRRETIVSDTGNAYKLELEDLGNAIRTGAAPLLADDALPQAAALQALHASMVEHRPVDVAPLSAPAELEARHG